MRQCLDPNQNHVLLIDIFEEVGDSFCLLHPEIYIEPPAAEEKHHLNRILILSLHFHRRKKKKKEKMTTSFHVRSNSLPSKPHPFTSEFDEQFNRLKSSETSTSSSSIGYNLNGLQDMYGCVDKLLQLFIAQQSLSQGQHKSCIHDLLDGSLVLLDMCSIAKESLSQIKESTLELQSVLRRRHGGELNPEEIKKYFNSRKVVKKAIQKALKNLKAKESCIVDDDHETRVMVSMSKETEEMTVTVFKSLLSFVSGPKSQSKISSIVSKIIQSKKIAPAKEEADVNEFEKVDAALFSFIAEKKKKFDDIFDMQNQLKDQEMCILDLEDGVECISSRLIKTKVTLLNILNN